MTLHKTQDTEKQQIRKIMINLEEEWRHTGS
jgi:hypothetical protein